MAEKRARLTLKFGDKEVRYEAEREAVEAQLESIVGLLLQNAPPDACVELSEVGSAGAAPPPSEAALAEPLLPRTFSETQGLAQLFAIGKGGRLTLRKLPERTADVFLLVLYGLLELRGLAWVHAPSMTRAARASGAHFTRADRLLAGYQDLFEGVGNRRAKRYRLTAAGREHCQRLARSLVEPSAASDDPQGQDPQGADAAPTAGEPVVEVAGTSAEVLGPPEAGIPARVTAQWSGELLTVAEAAKRLGVDEAEVGRLRRQWFLLGLPGGTRQRRLYFYPAFQIDAARRQLAPRVREVNRLVVSCHTPSNAAAWWSSVDPRLGKKPVELIGTPEADAVLQAAKDRFDPSGLIAQLDEVGAYD